MRVPLTVALLCMPLFGCAQSSNYEGWSEAIRQKGMREMNAYKLLTSLCTTAPHRLSGSAGYDKASRWGLRTLQNLGFDNPRLQEVMVPHWVRGREELLLLAGGRTVKLGACALGGSVATPRGGIEAEVIEAKSIADVEKLGDRARGKIVFLNGPMDPTLTSTFAAYGGAVGQRSGGASAAAKVGAVAVLVRSMTMREDDVPHTGAMRYQDGIEKIPAAAVSLKAANQLKGGGMRVKLTLTCQTLPDKRQHNVLGEIRGSEKPNEVIVVGGHLDGWDKGVGAHDDGAGIAHSIEALRLIKDLGWKPKRTIRVVLFANEENGLRGGRGYAEFAKGSAEKHIAAIESDAGGFAPRGFSCSYDASGTNTLSSKWLPSLKHFEISEITAGGSGGADIGPLKDLGTVLFGLSPESQRYFDYHHSDNDQLDQVNPRELQLGANAIALLAWMLSEEGV